jgi:hypothetical protein
MKDQIQHPSTEADVGTIKRICLDAVELEQIWDDLESKGIEATPGIVYQAITEQTVVAESSRREPGFSDEDSGLTARDLEALGQLARKAGGVEPLKRALSIIDRIPK